MIGLRLSRRGFLQASAFTGAAVALGRFPVLPTVPAAAAMPLQTVDVVWNVTGAITYDDSLWLYEHMSETATGPNGVDKTWTFHG